MMGAYQCICDEGYKQAGSGTNCVDVDECVQVGLFTLSSLILFGRPFHLIQFDPNWIHFDPMQSNEIQYDPTLSNFIQFNPFDPI